MYSELKNVITYHFSKMSNYIHTTKIFKNNTFVTVKYKYRVMEASKL